MDSLSGVDSTRPCLSRREVLRGAMAGATLLLINGCTPASKPAGTVNSRGTTGGAGPALSGRARGTIRGSMHGDVVQVPPGETLRFDPSSDTTLELSGNLIVLGRLEMRPEPGVQHVLRFVNVDESAFVGGGMDPIDSDVGLWVVENGQLDIRGTNKEAWNRVGASGTWQRRDELVVAPIEPDDFEPMPFGMGDVVPAFGDRRAEVLNLTRDVRIEGTPNGRAHVFISSTRPQSILYASLRYLGPRQANSEYTQGVLGRYGLHFHHAHDGSRGSLVQGVVVRDCGNHAFVPHMSHGITIRDCIAYETFNEAYWWDPHDRTNDLVLDRCVAASVHFDPDFRGYRLAGFLLGAGGGLKLRRCVTFAVQGAKDAAGFVWPEAPSGLWDFEDNVAHNNAVAGILVWQNVGEPHVIERFTAFNNGITGIIDGAYANSFHYRDLDLRDQTNAIEVLAAGRADPRGRAQSWVDVQGGGLEVKDHNLAGEVPILFERCSFPDGVTLDDGGGQPGPLDFVDCGLEAEDFTVVSLNPETVVRIQRSDETAFELTSTGSHDIGSFYPYRGQSQPTTPVEVTKGQ